MTIYFNIYNGDLQLGMYVVSYFHILKKRIRKTQFKLLHYVVLVAYNIILTNIVCFRKISIIFLLSLFIKKWNTDFFCLRITTESSQSQSTLVNKVGTKAMTRTIINYRSYDSNNNLLTIINYIFL